MAHDDDSEVDALFELPVGEFVAARDRLAAERRKAGDRPGADAVKSLRRPTVVAWILNQLARSRRDAVDALLELGRQAADAQQQALAGDASSLRDVDRSRRAAVAELVEHAAGLAGGSRAQLDEVEASVQAASLDPDGAGARWRAGRLFVAIPPASGFDPALGGWGLADQAPAPHRRRPALAIVRDAVPEPRPTEAERKAEAERVKARRREREEARRTAAQRVRAAERAEAALARLEGELAEFEARVADAREQADQARAEAQAAEETLAALDGDGD